MIVYSGELDATKGKLKITTEMFVFDGSDDESWGMFTVNTDQHMFRIYNCPRKSGTLTGNTMYSKCNSFTLSTNESTGRTQGKYSGTGTNVDFVNNDCADVSAWRTWLSNNPIQFLCELATPISIDMDSVDWQTQLGDNNFYNDCGDTEVTYRQDIALALAALQGSRSLSASLMRSGGPEERTEDPEEVRDPEENIQNTEEQEGDNDAR